MPKKIAKIFLTLTIIIVIIYSGAWFAGAYFIKNNFSSNLPKLKEKLALDINFSSMGISGYPFNFIIKLSKPTISNKDFAFSSDKELELSTTILTKNLALALPSATLSITTSDNKQLKFNIVSDYTIIDFNFVNSLILSLIKGEKDLHAKELTGLIIKQSNAKISDVASSKLLKSIDKIDANFFENIQQDHRTEYSVTLEHSSFQSLEDLLPQIISSPAYLKLSSYSPISRPILNFFLSDFRVGKTYLDTSGYELGSNVELFNGTKNYNFKNFDFKINKYNYNNDIINLVSSGQSILKKGTNSRDLSLHAKITASSKWKEFYSNDWVVRSAKGVTMSDFFMPDNDNVKDSVDNIGKKYIEYIIANPKELSNLVPNLYDLGPVSIDLDAVADINLKDVNINQFILAAKPYSIKLVGVYKKDSDSAMTFSISNNKQLISDLVDYSSKFLTFILKLNNSSAPEFILPTEFKTTLNETLISLSDSPKTVANDISFTCKFSKSQILPTISGLSILQVVDKLQTVIQPHYAKYMEAVDMYVKKTPIPEKSTPTEKTSQPKAK